MRNGSHNLSEDEYELRENMCVFFGVGWGDYGNKFL